MYLRKIISSGFKSFADKVTITLQPSQITGVIGPNGSGKSNIIDAVRWVMGEQSAKTLRGHSGVDLIFSGSSQRRSLGMAEVHLVFDNTEKRDLCPKEYRHFSEIVLTRRIYRDGSKEAAINGRVCRLRDLTDFFQGAGMGARGYSVIQQGQIGEILKAKPLDLYETIEEASGVGGYKKKKKEAQHKLQQAKANLERVEDLLQEIGGQKEGLRQQAEMAQKYRHLQGELAGMQKKIAAYDYQQAMGQKSKISGELVGYAFQIKERSGEVARAEQVLKQQAEQGEKHQRALASLTEEIAQLRETIAGQESSLQNEQSFLAQSDEREQDLVAALRLDREALVSYRQKWAAEKKEYRRASEVVENEKTRWEGYEAQRGEQSKRLAELKKELQELEQRSKSLSRQKWKIEYMQQQARERLLQCERSGKECEGRLGQNEEALHKKRIDEEAMSLRKHRCYQEYEKAHKVWLRLKEEGAEKEREWSCGQRELQRLQDQRARLEERYQLYQEMVERESAGFRGFYGAVEESPFREQWLPHDGWVMHEVAAELPQQVRAGIQYWLRRLFCGVSAKTRAQGFSLEEQQHLVALLQQGPQGMAHSAVCLVAAEQETIPEHHEQHRQGQVQGDGGAVAAADWLVLCPRYFAPAGEGWQSLAKDLYYWQGDGFPDWQELCGRIVVFASGLVVEYGRYVFVCDGQRSEEGSLDVSARMAVSADRLSALTSQIAALEQRLQKDRDSIRACEECREAVHGRAQELKDEVAREQEQLQSLHYAVQYLQQTVTDDEALKQDLGEQKRKISDEIQCLDAEHASCESQGPEMAARLSALEQKKASIHQEMDAGHSAYEESRLSYTAAQSQTKMLEKSCAEFQRYIESLEETVKSKETALQNAIVKRKRSETLRMDLTASMRDLLAARSEKEHALTQMREIYRGVEERLQQAQKQREGSMQALAVVQSQHQRAQGALERAYEQIQNVLADSQERGWGDEKALEEEASGLEEAFDRGYWQKKQQSWKKQIEGLGAVNFIASQQYDSLLMREAFFVEQREELLQSLQVLDQTITEAESICEQKFMDTYTLLNEEFGRLFPILFPRGKAHLQLVKLAASGEGGEDVSSPATLSGVQIMVQLPGKKLQSLDLFSGGEKALIAVALVMSFLKTKPTPFCLLDEVDAPLDESNVVRYNRLLQELNQRFQFLVVTHNRKTMEAFDTLYGVVMQEPGVSKVVSVDFDKALPPVLKKSTHAVRSGATL